MSYSPSGLLFGFVFLLFWVAWPYFSYLKKLDGIIRRRRVQEMALRVGRPTEVPYLDLMALERATEEIKALEFVEAGDYVTFSRETARVQSRPSPLASPIAQDELPPDPMETAGFCRVFLHERERCIAKIIASTVIPNNGRPVVTVFLRSFLSFADAPDGGEIWSYATSDLQHRPTADAISKLWRRLRSLGTRLPNTPVRELWRVHLRRRAEVAQVARLHWNRATLRESLDSEARASHNIRACFAQLTPFKMARLLRRYKRERKTTEWLGELQGKLPPLSP